MTAGRISGHATLVSRKRGDQWYLKYRLSDGRQVQKRLGPAWTERSRPPAGYFTKRMAEEALGAVLTDARRGVLPDQNESGATFADAAAEYLRYVEKVKQIDAATLADYRGVVDGFKAEFGETPIEKVTPDAIEAYRDRLMSERRPDGTRKLSNRTIVRYLTVLHGIFKRAKRVWGLTSNPASAELIERPKVVYTGAFDTLDGDEIELLATHATDEQDAAIYRVAAFTGLRQGELLGLRWGCVDFVGGLLHVRRNYTRGEDKIPKGKRVRSVPMMPAVIDVLASLKEREHFTDDDDLVFCSTVGDYLDHYKLRRRFYDALDSAGLRRIRFHDLRHAFGTAAITTLDPFAVQSYMGHQHYSTTQRYLHHKPRREDAARLADAFGSVPNRVPNPGSSGATQSNSEHESVPEGADQG